MLLNLFSVKSDRNTPPNVSPRLYITDLEPFHASVNELLHDPCLGSGSM